ncbi:MAG: hypothetical protein R2827_02200 [Bdellovibrionales bacterium]
MDLSTGVTASITAALGTISLPGIDILCIFIFATYPLKIVHKPIGGFRKLVDFSSAKAWETVNTLTGVNSVLAENFQWESGIQRLERLGLNWIQKQSAQDLVSIHRDRTNELTVRFLNPQGEVAGYLDFATAYAEHESHPKTYLKSMGITPNNKAESDLMRSLVRAIGPMSSLRYNVNRHIQLAERTTPEFIENLSKQFYIESATTDGEFVKYVFEDRAINVRRGVIRQRTCRSLF